MAADEPEPRPEFGPGGYLPERSAKRARKIVLREQMGLQWPIAAALAALLVVVAGGIFLATGTGPPAEPFVPVITSAAVDPRGAEVLSAGDQRGDDLAPAPVDLAIVRAGGGVRVFVPPTDAVVFCAESGRLEAPGGAVWNTNGRLVGGAGESLQPLASQVFDGVVYVDPTSPGPRLPPETTAERPSCFD